jgi:FkbM family methyltransferase
MINSQSTPLLIRKLVREILVGLSKLGIRTASLNYHGLKIKIPLIHGMGRFHFIPDFSTWQKNNLMVASKLWPEKTVIDIGANVGQFMLNLKSVNQNLKYIGFEPNPPCVFYLYELVRLNRFANTHIFPVAVSMTDGISYLHSNAWDSGTSTMIEGFSPSKTEYSTSIYAVAGDKFLSNIPDDVSFVKIDVEGFEYEVLKGIKETLKSKRPVVFCEVLTNLKDKQQIKDNVKDIYDFATELNLIIYKPSKDSKPVKVASIDDFNCAYSQDYVFVPQEKTEKYLGSF